MSESEKHYEIAKVESTSLGYEDHGILTCWLHLKYGTGVQGAGGYALDEYDEAAERRVGTAYGCEFIVRLMRACGVDEWSKVKGRTVYAVRDGEGFGARVIGIAPLPTEKGEEFLFDSLKEMVTP